MCVWAYGRIGWTQVNNKDSLVTGVHLFGKGKNPWARDLFRGAEALVELSCSWEALMGEKPKPSEKLKKHALIYGSYLTCVELDKHSSTQAAQIKDLKSQVSARDSENERLGFKVESLVTQNNTLTSQVGRLELKIQDLSEMLGKWEEEVLSAHTQQGASQAVIRELLKELSSSQEQLAENNSCLQERDKLQDKLRRTRGMLQALNKTPVYKPKTSVSASSSPILSEEEFCRASLWDTSDSHMLSALPQEASEEGLKLPIAPVTTTVVSYGLGVDRLPETRQELKAYIPKQARVVGKTLGPLTRDMALDWLAQLCSLPGVLKEDAVSLTRECMAGDD
ncbi:unnamed protein product [Caretta caretta]